MSWQEELRKLDEELASGRLSADDYRVRRDQVLSSAVGQPDTQQSPPPQNGGNNADSTQVIAPISPPQGTPQQQPPADNSADRTQAVQPWQLQQQQQAGDAGRTEYVAPPQTPYSPPHGFPQSGPASPAAGFPQAQQPWNAPESDQSPPWGGGDLPPLVPTGDSGWVQQGPESFEDKPKKGNGAKIGAIVAAVVVLAGIAVGAFVLWGGDSGGGSTEQTSAAPAPTSVQAPPDPMAVADIPGTAENYDSIKSFTQIPALNYLTSDELSTYETAQASDVKFVVHNLDGGARVIMMLTEVNSPAAAQNAVSQLLATQVRNGATRVTDTPAGVLASSVDSKDGAAAQIRAHYAHDNVVVRIEVTAPGSLQTARTNFDSILDAQLKVLPSNG